MLKMYLLFMFCFVLSVVLCYQIGIGLAETLIASLLTGIAMMLIIIAGKAAEKE